VEARAASFLFAASRLQPRNSHADWIWIGSWTDACLFAVALTLFRRVPGQNFRKLIADGYVIRKPAAIHSRARVNKRNEAKSKGRHTGTGKRHGTREARFPQVNYTPPPRLKCASLLAPSARRANASVATKLACKPTLDAMLTGLWCYVNSISV
jgi:hypothetical protein